MPLSASEHGLRFPRKPAFFLRASLILYKKWEGLCGLSLLTLGAPSPVWGVGGYGGGGRGPTPQPARPLPQEAEAALTGWELHWSHVPVPSP